jgi:topoisomerase-4 subunit B
MADEGSLLDNTVMDGEEAVAHEKEDEKILTALKEHHA